MNTKVALVTGGASGMGQKYALLLARRGAVVAIFDRNAEALKATAAMSERIHPFRCDISDLADVLARVAEVVEQFGPIDRIVHCAAIMPSRDLVNEEPKDALRLMHINYGGTLNMVKAVLPSMLARNTGEIILFGSIAGQAMVPRMGAYCASKAAVNVYAETLIHELAHTNLRIHLVCPPAVDTPLIDQTMATDTPGSIAKAKESGRLADPGKVVDYIEKCVSKGKTIIYPGEARWLYLWHALAPKLWWKAVMHFEK